MNAPPHRSSLLLLQLIMDISSRQKLRLHAPKLLLWVPFEACTIATTVLRVGCTTGMDGWVGGWVGRQCMEMLGYECLSSWPQCWGWVG